jgi:ribosome-binding protein aMBF1 (putative translation factor)
MWLAISYIARVVSGGNVLARRCARGIPVRCHLRGEVSLSAIDVHVGHRIAARRQASGWSIKTLAARAGLPVPRLHAYEAGERRVVASDLLSLSEAFEVLPSYFFEEFSPEDTASAKPDAEAWMSDWPKE